MNKLFTKIATLAVGAVMAIGVGIAVKGGREAVRADEEAVYTLDGTVTGGSSGYAADSEILQNGVNWLVTGNTTMSPWRIGGKNLSGVDRLVKSVDAVSESNISKIELTLGTANATLNSLTLNVGTSAGANDISSLAVEFKLSSTVTINRPNEADWSSKHFTFVFNVNAGSSNQYVQFSSAIFYAGDSQPQKETKDLVVGESAITLDIDETRDVDVTVDGNPVYDYELASSNELVATVNSDDGIITAVAVGTAVITVSMAEDENYKYKSATINVTVVDPSAKPLTFVEFTGEIEEGDYLITYDNGAMNTTTAGNRLQYVDVIPDGNLIVTTETSIIWHIAPSNDYWTLYNAAESKYAASTGVKNQATTIDDGTNDKALWTISGNETYEFVNKANAASSVNCNLRKNGTYGFACYSTSTGGALKLYKFAEGEVVKHNYVDIYFSNNKGWEKVNAYAWLEGSSPKQENMAWPGAEMEYVRQNQYNESVYKIHLDTEEFDHIIFNNGVGVQSADLDISKATNNLGFYLDDENVAHEYTYYPKGQTIDEPLNAEEAYELASTLNKTTTLETYYVKDVVVAAKDSSNADTPYVKSDRGQFNLGTEEKNILIYNAVDFNNGNFAEDLLVVGDEVLVSGKLQDFVKNDTHYYELSGNPTLISVNGYGAAEYAAVANALAAISCDVTGVASTINWEGVMTAMYGFADLKVVAANENGNRLAQFMAKYDYIVAKYGTEKYQDFLDRQPTPISGANTVSTANNDSIMLVVAITAATSAAALGLLIFLRKKRLAK